VRKVSIHKTNSVKYVYLHVQVGAWALLGRACSNLRFLSEPTVLNYLGFDERINVQLWSMKRARLNLAAWICRKCPRDKGYGAAKHLTSVCEAQFWQ
jgi:hypothetical protein